MAIELLEEEIRELTYQLKQLTTTVIGSEEALAKALNVQSKTVRENNKLLDQFGREIKSSTGAVKDNTQATGNNTEEVKKNIRSRSALTEAEKRAYDQTLRNIREQQRDRDMVTDLMNEFGRGTTATSVLREQFEKGSDGAKLLTATLEGVTKSITSFAAALYKGERGMLPAAKAATELTKPLIQLGEIVGTAITVLSFFVPAARAARMLGLALYGTAKAVGLVNDLNEKGAEQTDKLLKQFNNLSRAGVGLTGGINTVFELTQALGLTVAELEEFNKLITSNVDKLSLFGATAAGGTRRFAAAAGEMVKAYGRELELMGITRDEQREAMLSYMALQARSGQLGLKNAQQLATEGAKFARELDLMAQLTGTSREAQQKAIDANMADARFRSAQRAAELRSDQEEIRRLAKAEQLARMLRAAGMQEEATGVLQYAAGGGAMATPQAVMANMQFGLAQALNDPNTTVAQTLQRSLGFAQQQIDALVETTRFTGQIGPIQGDIVKIMDANQRLLRMQEAAASKGMSLDEFMSNQQAMQEFQDKETQRLVDAGRSQQSAAMGLDGAVRSFVRAGNTFSAATKLFAEAVNAMPGGKPIGGGMLTAPGEGPAGGGGAGGGGASGGLSGVKDLEALVGSLRLKSKEAIGGGDALVETYKLAKIVQDTLGNNLLYFSAFNDTYDKRTSPKHSQGKAFDFVLRRPDGMDQKSFEAYTEKAAEITNDILGSRGSVRNEYLRPSESATGGHIHAELFRSGGIAVGPKSGYAATLHGTEAVVPLPDGKNIPVQMTDFSNSMGQQMSVMGAQLNKLEELVSAMRDNNAISNKILQATSYLT